MHVKKKYLTAALLLWVQCIRPSWTCIDPDLAECTAAYTSSLTGSVVTHKDQFCGVLQEYHSCIGRICNTFPQDMLDFIIDAQTHYFNCGITSASLRVVPSTLPLLVSVMLSTYSLRCWHD